MSKNDGLSFHHIVVQGEDNIVSDMDGEKVMLSILNGKYYNLGEIGGAIWELIEEPLSIKGVVDALMKEYEVDRTICEEQVISFLNQLVNENLVQVKDQITV